MTKPASPALASISSANRAAIEDAAVLIRKAERAVVLTGAGISTPSGKVKEIAFNLGPAEVLPAASPIACPGALPVALIVMVWVAVGARDVKRTDLLRIPHEPVVGKRSTLVVPEGVSVSPPETGNEEKLTAGAAPQAPAAPARSRSSTSRTVSASCCTEKGLARNETLGISIDLRSCSSA